MPGGFQRRIIYIIDDRISRIRQLPSHIFAFMLPAKIPHLTCNTRRNSPGGVWRTQLPHATTWHYRQRECRWCLKFDTLNWAQISCLILKTLYLKLNTRRWFDEWHAKISIMMMRPASKSKYILITIACCDRRKYGGRPTHFREDEVIADTRPASPLSFQCAAPVIIALSAIADRHEWFYSISEYLLFIGRSRRLLAYYYTMSEGLWYVSLPLVVEQKHAQPTTHVGA